MGFRELHGPHELPHVLGNRGLQERRHVWSLWNLESPEQHPEPLPNRDFPLFPVPDFLRSTIASHEGMEEFFECDGGTEGFQSLVYEGTGGSYLAPVHMD